MKIFIALILLLALITSGIGCDRQVVIRGKVYEWVDPPAGTQSHIYSKDYTYQGLLQEDLPADANLKPLKDVMVQCYGKIKADTFYSNEVTDENGEFKLVIRLGRITEDYNSTIEVHKTGYLPAQREIVDSGSSHTLNIILVKE
jgi:hypothetical protein